MNAITDLRVDNDIIWATPTAPLQRENHEELTHRALALAGDAGHGLVMFDYRRAVLTHDVLARHAVWLVKADLGMAIRAALLVRHVTPDSDFWARLLWLSGVTGAVFTEEATALRWLQGQRKHERQASTATQHDET